MQYIAALPFVFCGGVLLTLVVIAPAALAPGASGLLSLLPTVGYTFVGTAIAFLSTAVFAMYVIRIVEPRLADGPARGGFRASWEFAVPPLLLLLALALTPSLVNVAIHAWLPWIAFMLASSLCLACGLVYYGIFKDAKKGRNRIDRLQRRIDKLRGVFSDADEGDGEDGGFVAQLRHLHDVRRELRLARIGVAPSAQTVTRAGVFRDVLQWFRRKRRSNTNDAGAPSSMSANILNGGYRPVDFENSAELVSSIERERARLAAIEAELVDIDRAIETSEKLVEYEALMGLVRRRELACSRRDASPHVDSLRKANVSAIEQLLLIRVRTAAGSATAAKPFFNGERQAIATEVPYSENANEPGGPNE
ncbi:MAG TPA: hypothetical protein VF698_03345 [Thermoanaerobaculia bacterium]